MSRITEIVVVPEHREERTAHFKCELCPAISSKGRLSASWDKDITVVNETTVQLTTGYSYPGDYSAESVVLDICPKCFTEKLVPWFVAQGGTVRQEEN